MIPVSYYHGFTSCGTLLIKPKHNQTRDRTFIFHYGLVLYVWHHCHVKGSLIQHYISSQKRKQKHNTNISLL
nr:hypothetical protein Itr_chr15CG07350 [Ipomoea trifida]